VGGHCIPKDPWLLAHSVDGLAPLRLIPAARAVNDGMPLYVAELAGQALRKAGRELTGARVAVLGLGYREDSADMRNSPSVVLADRLKELGATTVLHDPWVAEYSGDVLERVAGCDAVVVMVAHSSYQELDLARLGAALRLPVLVDARRVFDAAQARSAGLIYCAVGLG
jgi:UDP-N-acetyl-D-mannosaminuronate dehydrogenase